MKCKLRCIKIFFILLSLHSISADSFAFYQPIENVIKLKSPSGLVNVQFILNNGKVYYSLVYKKDTLISPSSLGFVLADSDSLMEFRFVKSNQTSFYQNWNPVWGQFSTIQNNYNELKVELKDVKKNRLLNIFFRVYDDGFAFRYEIPKQQNIENIVVMSEESRISFSGDYECWWSWADYNTLEKLYFHTSLDSASFVATPFTLKKSTGTYISIHEAAVDNYSTMTLKQVGDNKKTYKVNLVPWADGSLVKTKTTLLSPWRFFIIADNPGGLIESNLILNLNEPSVVPDVTWIKPMTYIGIWWEMHLGISKWISGKNHGASTENVKKYIDFAAEHNVKGVLVEGWNKGWEIWGEKNAFDFVTPYADFKLKEIVEYARSKGIEIIGHHETGGDTESYEKNLDKAFSLYQKLGIRVVKTGYAGPVVPVGEYHHGQCMVQHYNKVMRIASHYNIMLDVHEPVMLSGLSRTYPNLMTAEGVRGMEWNAWSDGNPPSHTCTLPFTRGIAGPMDYTPGIFDIDLSNFADKRVKWNSLEQGNTTVHSTLVNQLALMIVLYSPLQMASDLPENYNGNKAFTFIENLPTTWDETKVIVAEIGEYVIIARRKGNVWYVGGITNEKSREIRLPLNFLTKEKKIKATMYSDGKDADYMVSPESFEISEMNISSLDILPLKLAAGGGVAIRIAEE